MVPGRHRYCGRLLIVLAALASLGLPVLRLAHQIHHERQQPASIVDATSGQSVISSLTDDHDADCPLCALLAMTTSDATAPTMAAVELALPFSFSLSVPPIGWAWCPGASRQPPARGPPSVSSS